MNADTLYEAIGEIRDDFIQDAQTKRPPAHKRVFKSLIAACVTVALLALPVSAEVRNGYVSNLLAPLYGGARTELVDSIGVPVGASVTVGDYTLTADAVIGDRYNIAVVYTLKRNDGEPMPEGIYFAEHTSTLRAGSGGGVRSHELSEDGRSLQIVTQWTSSHALFRFKRNVNVTFQDLVLDDEESGEDILIAEGSWELAFTLRYEDTAVKLPVKNLEVTGIEGNQYQIRKILISPVGIHIDMTAPNLHFTGFENSLWPDFTVSVLLADGTVIELEDRNMGGKGSSEAPTFDADFGAMFDAPIPVEEMTALIICDTMVPIE